MTCSPGSPPWSTDPWPAAGRSPTAPHRSSCSAEWVRSGGGWAETCSTPAGHSPGPPPRSIEFFADLSGWSVIDEMRRDEADSRVTSTAVAQPANFLVQVGLAAELAHYGVHPKAIVGHSVGEVSAAYVSGMLSLEDAVKVSYHRVAAARPPRPARAGCSL